MTSQSDVDLRNESNIFSVDRGTNNKGGKTASMRVAHCCRCFQFFFSVDTSINQKNIRFISYHLIFTSFRDSKLSCKPLLNNIFFSTFKVVEIHMTSL